MRICMQSVSARRNNRTSGYPYRVPLTPYSPIRSRRDYGRYLEKKMDLELYKEVIANVNWNESWLWGVAGFHTVTFVSIIITRGRSYIQAVIFCLLAILCFSSEYLNEWAANNYQLFSEEQYFDSSGFFIFVIFATPIILNCLLIIMLWLCEVWSVMSELGRARVKQIKKQRDSINNNKKK